jgi:hypothetical protein
VSVTGGVVTEGRVVPGHVDVSTSTSLAPPYTLLRRGRQAALKPGKRGGDAHVNFFEFQLLQCIRREFAVEGLFKTRRLRSI